MKNEMNKNQKLLGIAGLFALTRCGGEAPAASEAPAPIEIGFVSPRVDSVLPTEFLMEMYASGVTIAPIDRLDEGSGYFVIALDGRCVPPGTFVPFAFPYLHLVGGETLLWVSLYPGPYEVCLMVVGPDGRTLTAEERLRFFVR